MQHVKAGRLKAIATTMKTRVAMLPDVAAANETPPGYEVDNWHGLVAPAGTPRGVIERRHGEFARAIRLPANQEKLAAQGIDPVGGTPREIDAFWKAEIAK